MLNGTLIGQGAFRYVIDLGDNTVLKVALNDEARIANDHEISAWQYAQDDVELLSVLCPILDYCPEAYWVLMPKAQIDGRFIPIHNDMGGWDMVWIDTNDDAEKTPEIIHIRRVMARHNYFDVDARNVGVVEGRTVLIDYGDDGKPKDTGMLRRTLGADGLYDDRIYINFDNVDDLEEDFG